MILDAQRMKTMAGDQDAWHTLNRRTEFPLDPANVVLSRPIYPYETGAKYLGHGAKPGDELRTGSALR